MDGRFNTIAGWVLGAGIVLLGANLVTDEIFKTERPETKGYPIEGVESRKATAPPRPSSRSRIICRAPTPPRRGGVPQMHRPATMPTRAAPTALGPNLWGRDGRQAVARRRAASAYSDALSGHGGTLGLGDDERLAEAARAPSRRARG